jgi:hypothetical protein
MLLRMTPTGMSYHVPEVPHHIVFIFRFRNYPPSMYIYILGTYRFSLISYCMLSTPYHPLFDEN